MDPEALEGMLNDRITTAPRALAGGDDDANETEAKRLAELAGKVQSFVDAPGDLEGAKFDELSGFISRISCLH